MSEIASIAQAFHEAYEYLASDFDYVTRSESRCAWEQVPENNKRLMMAVVMSLSESGDILLPSDVRASVGTLITQLDEAERKADRIADHYIELTNSMRERYEKEMGHIVSLAIGDPLQRLESLRGDEG